MRNLALVMLPMALLACSQKQAPSEQLKDAAGDLADDVAGMIDSSPPKGPFAPRDACASLPGYAAFRAALADAVGGRDADALAKLADANIRLDFGGGSGKAELIERLANPDRHLWDELDELLELGCSDDGSGAITLPSFFAQDIGDADPYTSMIVTSENVPVYRDPESKAEVLGEVSWDIVELVGVIEPDRAFQNVRMKNGDIGYIATNKVRSVIDYRLLANQTDGNWRITALVAGD